MEKKRALCCTLGELLQSANDKADTGDFESWREVGAALDAEGCNGATKRLGADAALTRTLTERCLEAKRRRLRAL